MVAGWPLCYLFETLDKKFKNDFKKFSSLLVHINVDVCFEVL